MIIHNLNSLQAKQLAEKQRLHGREKGLDLFLEEQKLEIEYFEDIGEHYFVNKIPPKEPVINPSSSPKMFYTPDEISHKLKNLEHIQIMFNDFNFSSPIASHLDNVGDISSKITVLNYTKLRFKNSDYEYIFVQDEQMDLFKEMYLDIKRPQAMQKTNKVYI